MSSAFHYLSYFPAASNTLVSLSSSTLMTSSRCNISRYNTQRNTDTQIHTLIPTYTEILTFWQQLHLVKIQRKILNFSILTTQASLTFFADDDPLLLDGEEINTIITMLMTIIVTTSTKFKSWMWHENDFNPPPPTTHTNSMSAISQLLLTQFQPNFKVTFLG